MKKRFKSFIRATLHSFGRVACPVAVMLMIYGTQAQNLFVSNFGGNIIRITPGGTQSTFASGLSWPDGVAFDAAGNMFVADYQSGHIYEFTPSGVRSTFASGLFYPSGLAFNSAGDLFEADWFTSTIKKYTPSGVKSTFASGLDGVAGLAFGAVGDLLVTSFNDGTITRITPAGVQSTFASGLNNPFGLAFNSAGDLFVADVGSGNIFEFTPDGTQSTFASGLNGPWALAFNSVGDLFESDEFTGDIHEFTPSGVQSTFASGLGGANGLAFQDDSLPTPYHILQSVNAQLTALLSTHNSSKVQSVLKQAITDINLSLTTSNWQKGFLALNSTKGVNTINNNAFAIQALTTLSKVSGVSSQIVADANTAMGSIAQADISLANTALLADKGHGNINMLHQSAKDLTMANAAFTAGKFSDANTDAFTAFQLALEAK